jgi:acid phosphatase
MDLDETVLDNSAFESFLQQNNLDYTDALWEVYERDYPEEVLLIPGAKTFIESAEKKGVAVVYLSNRMEEYRASTLKALKHLGLNTTDNCAGRLFLRHKGASSDKSARREQVAARYNVLLYFGDSLRDFSEAFVAPKVTGRDGKDAYGEAIRRRLGQADDAACHWGVDWFVLPNPVYGEWEKLVGDDPRARLRPTKIKIPKDKGK